MLKKKLPILLFLITTSFAATAQIGQDTVSRIEAIFSNGGTTTNVLCPDAPSPIQKATTAHMK
jgi:hypothetical protein